MKNYFLDESILGFNSQNNMKNIDISLSKRFNKLEKEIIEMMRNQIELISYADFKIKTEDLGENAFLFLEKFQKKRIKYSCTNKNSDTITGSFPVLSSFLIQDDEVTLIISPEFFYSTQKNNLFYNLFINEIVFFKEKYTLPIFLEIIKEYQNGEVTLTIDEIKNILDIEIDKYPRYYDFEKNIILKSLKDINMNSHLDVTFEKIKNNQYSNSKITKIKFKLIDNTVSESQEFINNLLLEGKDHIKDFIAFQNICLKYLKIKKQNVIFKIFQESIQNYSGNFILFFEKALEKSSNDSNTKGSNLVIEKKYSSLFFLYSDIISTLTKKFKESSKNFDILEYSFIRDVLKLKNGESLEINIQNYIINIQYFKHKKSIIIFTKIS